MWNTDEPSPNAGLSDNIVASAETTLGVRFPESYLSALRIKNGGSIRGDLAKLPEQKIPEHLQRYVDHGYVSVYDINGIGASHKSVLETEYLVTEWDLPSPIVILSGDGHWWIALDYRLLPDNPPVVFIDSDSGDSLRIADDFAAFSLMLVSDDVVFDHDGNFIG